LLGGAGRTRRGFPTAARGGFGGWSHVPGGVPSRIPPAGFRRGTTGADGCSRVAGAPVGLGAAPPRAAAGVLARRRVGSRYLAARRSSVGAALHQPPFIARASILRSLCAGFTGAAPAFSAKPLALTGGRPRSIAGATTSVSQFWPPARLSEPVMCGTPLPRVVAPPRPRHL
jgi:hypothetical protein